MSHLRAALRSLISHPALSTLVIVTLALGIGANTAMFSAVNSLLLRDPPFAGPDRLVRITTVRGDEAGGPLSVPELDDIRGLPIVADAALYTDQGMYNASGFGAPEELQATITTHDLFRVLGVEPLVGATFPESFDRSRNFGLVISHGLWTRKFARDPNIVGRTLTLDGAPGYTIYGVMPPSFAFPSQSGSLSQQRHRCGSEVLRTPRYTRPLRARAPAAERDGRTGPSCAGRASTTTGT